jgi:hypothetical protein
MTTQLFPYANEAFEIAADRLGNGMNLRKVKDSCHFNHV